MFHYFKIPYFTCTFLTKFTYNEYIGPYFLSHVVLRFSPVISPRLNPNATYCEYILIALPHNTELESPFSSDDVNDISVIVIEKNEDDKIVWKGVFITEKPGKTEFLKCLFESSLTTKSDY
jgi:hypothetical protein